MRRRVYAPFDWTTFDQPSPRRRLGRPLERSRIALVASAGAHLPEQHAFDLGKSGDSSYRELPADPGELRFTHVGYDTRRAREDPDVVFPLSLLRRPAAEGEISELVMPSLACLVEHPFGLTLGAIGDEATHRAVLRACLAEASRPHPAGTIVDLGFRWRHDDLRERQLRKEAH